MLWDLHYISEETIVESKNCIHLEQDDVPDEMADVGRHRQKERDHLHREHARCERQTEICALEFVVSFERFVEQKTVCKA